MLGPSPSEQIIISWVSSEMLVWSRPETSGSRSDESECVCIMPLVWWLLWNVRYRYHKEKLPINRLKRSTRLLKFSESGVGCLRQARDQTISTTSQGLKSVNGHSPAISKRKKSNDA